MLTDADYSVAVDIFSSTCPEMKVKDITACLNELPNDILAGLDEGGQSIHSINI